MNKQNLEEAYLLLEEKMKKLFELSLEKTKNLPIKDKKNIFNIVLKELTEKALLVFFQQEKIEDENERTEITKKINKKTNEIKKSFFKRHL